MLIGCGSFSIKGWNGFAQAADQLQGYYWKIHLWKKVLYCLYVLCEIIHVKDYRSHEFNCQCEGLTSILTPASVPSVSVSYWLHSKSGPWIKRLISALFPRSYWSPSICTFVNKWHSLMKRMNKYLQVWCVIVSHQPDPSSVPQLAWQFVPVQKTVNPILAFCKGDTVHFLLVSAQLPQNFKIAKYTIDTKEVLSEYFIDLDFANTYFNVPVVFFQGLSSASTTWNHDQHTCFLYSDATTVDSLSLRMRWQLHYSNGRIKLCSICMLHEQKHVKERDDLRLASLTKTNWLEGPNKRLMGLVVRFV